MQKLKTILKTHITSIVAKKISFRIKRDLVSGIMYSPLAF